MYLKVLKTKEIEKLVALQKKYVMYSKIILIEQIKISFCKNQTLILYWRYLLYLYNFFLFTYYIRILE